MKYALISKRDISLLVIMIVWLLTVIFVISMTLADKVSTSQNLIPIYSVSTDEKKIALTFNCAWDDTGCEKLLEILQDEDVFCTFFFVGDFAEKYPETVRKIYNSGHELGNHSMSHDDPTKLMFSEIVSDMNGCNEVLYALTGVMPVFYRAPSGSYDKKTVEAAESLDMTAVQWDVDSVDWKNINAEKIYGKITGNVKNGSIVLFHLGKENTLEALPDIIDTLKNKGYVFTTVGDLIPDGELQTDVTGRAHAYG